MVYLHPAYIPHTIVGSVICVFNGVVVLLVARERRAGGCLGEPRHTLMASLAVADFWLGAHLLVATNVLFFAAPFDCKAAVMSIYMSVFVSTTMLIALTLNQFVAVRHPLRYHQIVTDARVNVAVAATWILSVLASAAITKLDAGYVIPNCVIHNVVRPEISLTTSIIVFFAPSAVLIIVNIYINSQARKHYNLLKKEGSIRRALKHDERAMATLNQERDVWRQVTRTTVTLTIVVFVFILSWTGYWTNALVGYLTGAQQTEDTFGPNTVFESLAVLNSLYNPIIYALRFRDFRRALRKLCCCGATAAVSNNVDTSF